MSALLILVAVIVSLGLVAGRAQAGGPARATAPGVKETFGAEAEPTWKNRPRAIMRKNRL